MKQIVCEMCGSTDIIKQDGIFMCQSCGMKYSLEEAKKMMIEGTVDVQGTVKVDNSAFVQKYLANARRAKEKEDWEETEKYYNMVEQNDPDNIEAIFYSSYGKAKSTLVDGDIYKRQAAFKVLSNCISVIDDHYQLDRKEENKAAINSMSADLAKMLVSNFVFTEWKNGYGVVTKTNKQETYNLFINLIIQFKESINNIQKIDDQPYLHEALITLYGVATLCDYINSTEMNKWIAEEKSELEQIRKKTIDAYWTEHADEKKALDDESNSLKAAIENKKAEIENLSETKALNDLESKVSELTKERDSLGLFKGKEKKALQEQIDSLNTKVNEANKAKEDAVKPYNEEISKLEARINEIKQELTKDR